MRQLAVLCSWMVLAAACSSAELPSASATPEGGSHLIRTIRPSPTLVVFTRGRVEMGDDYFAPDEINVTVGATVSWLIATGENNHDVVSLDSLFRSNSPMTRGVDLFSFTFTTPGEYRYVCSYHIPQGMVGKVIVK
jgi:plastocyanin